MPSVPIAELATITVERRGAVEWITLDRPDRLNAITPRLADELADRFAALRDDTTVRAVVLRGAGRAFCAGLDIGEHARGGSNSSGGDAGGGLDRLGQIVVDISECPQPVIALLHGPACGGGFAFALAADIRIAAPSARMNAAFVKLGLSGCELGLSYFLPRHVGMSVAAELMYTGRFIDAARALQLGLVSQVVDSDDDLEAAAETLLDDMLRASPLGLRMTKQTFRRAIDVAELRPVIDLEMRTQVECMAGPDFGEGLRAFIEKRPPHFVGNGEP